LAGLVVYLLIVLGVALIAFAFWVVRDEAPRWTWKVRRPGWAVILSLVAFTAAYTVSRVHVDINEAVRAHVGEKVECKKVGVVEVEAHQVDAYACVRDGADRRQLGCFALLDDYVLDVSRRVEEEGGIPGRPIDC
jgi:uncharacterized protein involved in cysteine biosynthesis